MSGPMAVTPLAPARATGRPGFPSTDTATGHLATRHVSAGAPSAPPVLKNEAWFISSSGATLLGESVRFPRSSEVTTSRPEVA